ncbi:MFS transporter [Bifidobacterium aemilianum]|uniref:MFS transporter n=1 Tax=Bifidobacterium aemilianum TaxID=2493120 RepID=A0A366K865_9BIFI|nr:MFS transporter [Bifidobacterium aemilianum]RBP97507.1 MFS transporter [Bifidobacterium aemilianum]
MKKSLIALAAGAFVLGAAEFVMMGILPQTATSLGVSIPQAGNFISAYAIGVCVGTLILVFGRKISPKNLVLIFMVLALVGNLASALSPTAALLTMSRFVAGLPHGAFFGTATLIAKRVAAPGREARAVSVMVAGQTVSNMLGVPAGSFLAEHLSWRLAFALLAAGAGLAIALSLAWIPDIEPVPDVGLRGQFHFLRKPGPWMVLAAVFLGNTGIFSWWSYVSPWLITVGGYQPSTVPWLMMLAGFGMVTGGLISGRVSDHWKHATTAALGQAIACLDLLLIFLVPGSRLSTALLTFTVAFGLFFINTPQQLLMANAGQGGGELIGGATVQVAFNFGNAVGSVVGGSMLNASGMNYHFTGLGGLPFGLMAVILLALYAVREEPKRKAIDRMIEVKV